MIPYKSILQIDRENELQLYLQLSNQFIQLIKSGILAPKTQLPSSRKLAEIVKTHRKTVVACYDELAIQGWVEMIPQKGTYVNSKLPITKFQNFASQNAQTSQSTTGFSFNRSTVLASFNNPAPLKKDWLYFDDGVCDIRQAPINEIGKIYRYMASKKGSVRQFGYGTTYGNPALRETLLKYLNETRGLNISLENILITRGSQMGIRLFSSLVLEKGSYIIVGETNYQTADLTFLEQGARLLTIPVDQKGLVTDAVEELCEKYPIKGIYVTSHHHHPTTVTLSAERRLHLLNLAQQYSFGILEDDYDYDFHYDHAPILPLASHDTNNNVVYVGSLCKTVAPGFRLGYLIGHPSFVDECAKQRRLMDRQGDPLLEMSFAEFIQSGALDRHIRKVLKIYKGRRDLICKLFKTELAEYFDFDIPKGGMAIWLCLRKEYSWKKVAEKAKSVQLEIGNWKRYDRSNLGHNGLRFGFATHNKEELVKIVQKLKWVMLNLD